ncbi:MAG: OsmC family protein [Polyangia bacterium]|jgi:ribosomal protein S12 methylthiotransferase accessory factor|nr:OsmC family protein [Polyangia bacterium]
MALEIQVTHSGNKKIDARLNGFTIQTDQSPRAGGDGSAPEPFALFLASLATCAGIYVVSFCQARSIPTEGIRLVQDHDFDPRTGKLTRVSLTVELPETFPEKYREAVLRAASFCTVKKTLESPPEMQVKGRIVA